MINSIGRAIYLALKEIEEDGISFTYYEHRASCKFIPVILSGCWDFDNFVSGLYGMFMTNTCEVSSITRCCDGDYRIEIIRHKGDKEFQNTIHFYINEKYF